MSITASLLLSLTLATPPAVDRPPAPNPVVQRLANVTSIRPQDERRPEGSARARLSGPTANLYEAGREERAVGMGLLIPGVVLTAGGLATGLAGLFTLDLCLWTSCDNSRSNALMLGGLGALAVGVTLTAVGGVKVDRGNKKMWEARRQTKLRYLGPALLGPDAPGGMLVLTF